MGKSDDIRPLEVKSLIQEANLLLATVQGLEGNEKSNILLDVAEKYIKALQLSKDCDEKERLRSRATELMNEAELLKAGIQKAVAPSSRPQPLLTFNREPESTRKLSNAEKRLILLASRFNGMKFPPWTRTPDQNDFALHSSPIGSLAKDGQTSSSNDGLFSESIALSLSPVQKENFQGWLRSSTAIPPPFWFQEEWLSPSMNADKPTDLVQDAAPDCSVVASLCAEQARAQRGFPTLLSKVMFPYDERAGVPRLSPNGRYIFKFNFNGRYRMVDVDDRLPVSKSKRVLHVVDRNNPHLLWPALLEKAYLKIRGGYDFKGSNSSTDIWVMYGWIPEQIYLHHAHAIAVWEKIAEHFVHGNVLITMGTGSISPSEEKEYGLASRHDYAVIDVSEEEGAKKLLLKNPWCEETLWQDREAGENSPAVDVSKKPRGTFWITLENIFQHFESMYLNWNPARFKHRQDIHFPWTLSLNSNSSTSYIDNPQFCLQASESGEIWLLLSHHFCEGCGHGSPGESTPDQIAYAEPSSTLHKTRHITRSVGSIALSAFKNNGKLVYTRGGAIKNGSYVESFHTLLIINALASETYTIVVAGEDLSTGDHTFTLTALCNSQVELSHATGKYPHSTRLELGWTSEVEESSYPLNVTSQTQLKLSISEATRFSMLLRSNMADDKVNLKVCQGGKRIYSLARQDIILDSGEFHKGADFCESGSEPFKAGEYTIMASVFGKPSGKMFDLRTDSSIPVQIAALPSEGAGKFTLSLPDAIFNPSVKIIALALDPLRYITITIVAKFLKHLLRSPQSGEVYASREAAERSKSTSGSPIRLSLEIGRGPMKQIAAISNRGEYSDSIGSAARLADVNLSPDMNNQATLWLVVERLSTGIGDVEEHYTIDILIAGGIGEYLKTSAWQERDE